MTTRARVLLVSANRERLPQPVVPLGALYVAAALRPTCDVELLDLCFEQEPHEALRTRLAASAPDVVGLALRNLHDNTYSEPAALIAEYAELARTIRAGSPAPLVLGGAGFSLQPERLLAALGADHGVVGEGERAMVTLVEALSRGERPPRLVSADAATGAPVPLGRARGAVLDALPAPARDLTDPRYFAFDGTANVQTKRGCAFSCTYCDYPDLEGRKVRLRSPARVAEEVAALAATPGVSHVFFVDSVFNVPRSHARAICDELATRGAPVPWVAYVTPLGLDDELAAAMARAGCVGVELGTDTGTPEGLARLQKPFSIDDVRRATSALRAAGVRDCHTFVLGAEGESLDEVRRTLEFADALAPSLAVFLVFTEDRADRALGPASNREEILRLLSDVAPSRRGFVVPELGVRFGAKISRIVAARGLRGPAWLHLG